MFIVKTLPYIPEMIVFKLVYPVRFVVLWLQILSGSNNQQDFDLLPYTAGINTGDM